MISGVAGEEKISVGKWECVSVGRERVKLKARSHQTRVVSRSDFAPGRVSGEPREEHAVENPQKWLTRDDFALVPRANS